MQKGAVLGRELRNTFWGIVKRPSYPFWRKKRKKKNWRWVAFFLKLAFIRYWKTQFPQQNFMYHAHLPWKNYGETLWSRSRIFKFLQNQDTDLEIPKTNSILHSAHWSINPPQRHHPLFLAKLHLKSANCPSPTPPLPPFLGNPPYILNFREPPP